MLKFDPQQELFTQLIFDIKAAKYAVYDTFLPPEGTPYPFVYIGDNQQTDEANKSAVFGRVHQVIHFWHNNPRQRGTVSEMMLNVKEICRKLQRTANFAWQIRGITQRIIPDNTTSTPLLHGVIEVDFYFS